MMEEKIGGFDRYKVENAARTLIEANEIKMKPKLYAEAKKEAAKQAKAASAVALEAKVTSKLKKVFRGDKK